MKALLALLFVLTTTLVVTGCADKAQPKYDECVKLESSGDLKGAVAACEAAVAASPESKSGKAASDKVTTLKAAIKKQEDAARAEAEKVAAAERQRLSSSTNLSDWKILVTKYPTSQEARSVQPKIEAAELEELRSKVSCEPQRFGACKPVQCAMQTKNKTARFCKGSSSKSNEKIALSKGCVHAYETHGSEPSIAETYNFNCYCCPE